MRANIPETSQKRIVILGAGFAGLKLARELINADFQIVLIDRFNYHQFQPLMYQVSTSALEPSSIAFPLRKIFQSRKNIHIRITEVTQIDVAKKSLDTSTIGRINYDILVIAQGTTNNFFGNNEIEKLALPMKSVPESISLRNRILEDYEKAISQTDFEKRQIFLNTVIVGGGPTGVEIAGALAEMKDQILAKDYVELNKNDVHIFLIDANSELLSAMSDHASQGAYEYLTKMGVNVVLGRRVASFDGTTVIMDDETEIKAGKLIWAAGVVTVPLSGIPVETIGRGNRLIVNEFNQCQGLDQVYAIGDCCIMQTADYSSGHPQLAQVAIQQATNLAKNLKNSLKGNLPAAFHYKDLGSMATIGRKRAVVDLPRLQFKGFFAWLVWLFVHLMAILGTKNKLFIFVNWAWSYITRDQSLRLIIKPARRPEIEKNC